MKGVANPLTGMTFGDMFAAPPTVGGFGYTEVTASAAMSDLSAFGFSGKLGVAWKVNENVSFGLSYTSPSSLTYKNGKAAMDMTAQLNDAFGKAVQGYLAQNPGTTPQAAQAAVMKQFGQLGIDLSKGAVANYDLEVGLKFPQALAFGTSVQVSGALTLAADVEWVNWKNAFDKMTLNLSNGSNPNINTMLGNNGTFSLAFPMDWKDALCFRLGAEYKASDLLTLRAGTAIGSNPVPAETVFPVFPAIVEDHIMVGASYRLSEPLVLHAAYELAINNKQTASAQSLIAQEYNGSTSQLNESIIHIALSWNF
jgi:long-subunit fatty acid transport protein